MSFCCINYLSMFMLYDLSNDLELTSMELRREALQNQMVCYYGDLHQYFLLICGMYKKLRKNTGRTNNMRECFNNTFESLIQYPNI